MGNSNKKPEDYEVVRSYKAEEWVNIEKKQNYEIWQNVNKKIRSEVYALKKQLKPIDLDHYQLRYNNSADIVKVHNLSIKEDSTLCAKSSNSHVYVERIPYRLSDIYSLTQQKALSVLKSAYSGFNTLSTFYGPVEPYEDLICFNETGKTKVWVNSNLAENGIVKDRQQNPISNFANLNAVYVNKLFDMVENKTQGGAFPPKLKNRFRQFNPKTYFQALNLIQQYATQQRIQIPPTINPRLFSSNSNEVGEFKNYSSQVNSYPVGEFKNYSSIVNSYPVAASQNLSWAPQTLQPSSQIQNPAVASTFQVRSSYPQVQMQSNYNLPPSPLQVSQTQYLQQSTVPQNSVSFRAPDQERSNLSMPLVGSASKIGFGPAIPLNVINSPRNNISVRPIQPTKQFDSPSKIVSMQAINKQPSVDVNQPVIQNRNKSIIGSVANLSQVKISEQPRSINIIFDDKASELSKPPSSSRLPQPGQATVSLNRNPELIINQQQKFTGGYLQQFSPMQPMPQQFVQGQHYNVNPISVGFNYSRPMPLIQQPTRPLVQFTGQYQFSPRIQQVNMPINITQQRQLNQNPIQQRTKIQIQAQPQPQPQPQYQYQAQLLQQQIQPQPQAQAQVQIQSRPQTQEKQTTTPVNQTQVQQINSQVQSQQQSETNSRPLSQQNRQNMINIGQRQDQVQNNSLSNNQQRLAEAYDDENDDYYDNDDDQNQEFGNQEGEGEGEEEEEDQGRDDDQFNRYQGLVEGQGDEVQRQLEKLQQQKIGDYQNQQTGQYFPFAGTFMGQNNQIKRFDTYEIKQGDLAQINKLEGQKSERQQNSKSVEQNKTTIKAQQTKMEQALQTVKETQPQQVPKESPLQVKQYSNSSPSQQDQQTNEKVVQKADSNKIETKNVNNYGNENVKASSNQYQYQYQYQYQSSIGQQSQQNRIPEDAQYEDIQQYIRNKYKNYIGVQSESSDYKPSSEVSPYYAGFNRVGQVQMASYVQSKYDQFSNQEVNFSFRPSIPAAQVTITQNRDEKPAMVSSYQYMRVEQMIGDPEQKQSDRKSSLMADNKRSEKLGNQDDILDVKNMERSLDKKYSSMKSNQQMNIDQVKKDEGDDNDVDVKKLEQHLIRFQQSRVGGPSNHVSGSSVEPRFETSQVSKIQSIDEILANRRRSSMNRGFEYKDQVITSKAYSYQNQSPVNQFGRKSRASKISKQLIDIDEKFNKYVKGGAAISSGSSSSKLILKPKEDNYNYRQFDYQNSSRMATGHFGYADNTRGEKIHESTSSKNYKSNAVITSQTKASKGPSYEELRKFMWS